MVSLLRIGVLKPFKGLRDERNISLVYYLKDGITICKDRDGLSA